MTQKNIDKIKNQIAALLAKAEGTDNQHEAESFAAKAAEMLEKHQLSLGDVVKNDPLERSVICMLPKTRKVWHTLLPNIVGRYYGCKVVCMQEQSADVYVAVGRESARVVAVLMYPFIRDELRAAAQTLRKETLFSAGKCMQMVVENFVIRIQDLMAAAEKVAAASGNGNSSHSRALVQIDEADAWMKANIDGLKFGKEIKLTPDARARELADGVKLGGQIDDPKAGGTLALAHG
jgi:hypothetical protein